MTIMRPTKSGKAIQVVLDNNAKPGVVYQIPIMFVQQMLTGNYRQPFSMMTRLPFFVDPDRYADSPLFDPMGIADEVEKSASTFNSKMELNRKTAKERDEKESLQDKKIEW